MNIVQIVTKTVISTLDLIVLLAAMKVNDGNTKKGVFVLILANLMGVWI